MGSCAQTAHYDRAPLCLPGWLALGGEACASAFGMRTARPCILHGSVTLVLAFAVDIQPACVRVSGIAIGFPSRTFSYLESQLLARC